MTFVLNHAELQPINGEVFTGSSSNIQDGARLEIVANGFWDVDLHVLSSMCRLLILMSLPTEIPSAIESINWRRNVSTSSKWERCKGSMFHLSHSLLVDYRRFFSNLKACTSKKVHSNRPPQNPLATMSSLAPSWMFDEELVNTFPLMGWSSAWFSTNVITNFRE